MSSVRLLRPGSQKHDGDRPEQNFQVKPERPIVNVFEVKSHPILEILDLIATADLPEAGEAGLYTQTAAMGQIVETFNLIHRQWTRPNKTHLAAQDVEELR